ncbi:MAG: tRNA uridine-5-carboxymethylaminomethyl(34) synthesis GTPase MnmE [Arachidicoccus sp.]|nr:tRNA uridine-5-carboxymethylaminomethyl(34) synthesis GTPase MnmE [Arachidicoccus sp.]
MQEILTGRGDTIVAIATAQGVGAIAVIRVSGANAIDIVNKIFPSKDLHLQKSHTLHVGFLKENDEVIDEVVISLFKNPNSYTGEDVIEISCHASPFIQQKIIDSIISKGARLAFAGEFTQRAFLNGKMDLTQAEAVADIIAADSKAAQQTALKQLRGGFSNDLKQLREELINFAALIELELDFSEEDVEFADRKKFEKLITTLKSKILDLINSFRLGNVIKNGVSVAIIGKPNAGKSTLLNALLNEERAIVSSIAGTTRDTIEETLNINGVLFRLIDTAGIREHTSDAIEKIGVEKSLEKMRGANIVVYLFDVNEMSDEDIHLQKELFEKENIKYILVGNKIDELNEDDLNKKFIAQNILFISAKEKEKIDSLKQKLYASVIDNSINTENTIVTNARHHAALKKIEESLDDIEAGMRNQLTGDLLSIDIRRALHYLGEITGQVEVDRDILGTIFGKFCIGK